jgi:hypothetical protein
VLHFVRSDINGPGMFVYGPPLEMP